MNNNQLDSVLADELWEGIKCIAIFISQRKCFFVIDYKENFILDMKKELSLEFKKGRITENQMREELSSTSYRYGVWQLDENTLTDYLKGNEVIIAEVDAMRNFLASEKDVNMSAAKLPLFYIDFDRKIYRHKDYGRMHQDYAYDWDAKEEDFESLVPESSIYWC